MGKAILVLIGALLFVGLVAAGSHSQAAECVTMDEALQQLAAINMQAVIVTDPNVISATVAAMKDQHLPKFPGEPSRLVTVDHDGAHWVGGEVAGCMFGPVKMSTTAV